MERINSGKYRHSNIVGEIMAEKNYNLQDIRDFMKQQLNLKWYYKIYDEEIGQYRPALMKDFERIRSWRFECIGETSGTPEKWIGDVVIIVNNKDFRIPWSRGDCSQEWQDFLAQRYGKEQGLSK